MPVFIHTQIILQFLFYTDRLSYSRKWGKVFIITKQFSSWENFVRLMKCLLNKRKKRKSVFHDQFWESRAGIKVLLTTLLLILNYFTTRKKIQHLQQDWYGLCCNKICKSAWCLFNFGNGYLGKWQKLTLTWFLKSPSTINKPSVFLTSTSPNYRYFWKLDKLQQASFPESRGICGGSLRRIWGRTFESGEEEGNQSQLPLWEHTVI